MSSPESRRPRPRTSAWPPSVKRRGSPRLAGFAVVAALGLVGALALRRPELAIAAAPFAILLTVGFRIARDPGVELDFTVEAERTVEGVEIDAEVRIRASTGVDRVELLLQLPPGVQVVEGFPGHTFRLPAAEERVIPLRLRCTTWGLHEVGAFEVRARDLLRFLVWESRYERMRTIKAYPRPESLSRILAPVETQAFTGSEVSRVKGDGIEYADIRDFAPGDRVRAINWRASARRGNLVVNERHPERNTDVVLFVDSFTDVRGADRSTLDDAVRATATLATRYLERRDRVGLVSFGGVLRWLRPGMGDSQRYRLIETLLETGVAPTYTWRDVNVIPSRILPPKALVIALTPLVDRRISAALTNLRARGFDLVVVEVDPIPQTERGRSEVEQLAYRLWLLEREVLRARLEQLGIAVARWNDEVGLETALEGVRTYRRHARLARV
jgi:uncharacterized protein (DUF58 family)